MLERQTSSRRSSNVKSESSDKTKSAPASYKPKDSPDDRTTSASSKQKKESLIPKTIRTHTNSSGSIGAVPPRMPRERDRDVPAKVPSESGKVESHYSLPNSKLRIDTNQKTRKLQEVEGPNVNINAASKVNKNINTTPRRGEPIPNAVVTDLTQVHNQFNSEGQTQIYRGFEGHRQGQIKYPSNSQNVNNNAQSSSAVPFGVQNDPGLERGKSASSSSSHDDSLAEPRSWSCTNDHRSDKEVSLYYPERLFLYFP